MTELSKIEEYQTQQIETLIDSTNTFPPALKNSTARALILEELNMDVPALYEEAKIIIAHNEGISKEEVAVRLLGHVATQSKSKFIRKVACKMIKEEWWTKNDSK